MIIGVIDNKIKYCEKLRDLLVKFPEIESVKVESRIENFSLKYKNLNELTLILIHSRVINTIHFEEFKQFIKNYPRDRIFIILPQNESKVDKYTCYRELNLNVLNVASDDYFLNIVSKIKKEIRQLSSEFMFSMLRNINKDYRISITNIESTLTNRELEVMRFLLKGLTYNNIAKNLEISPHTVNDHVKKIYVKLGITSKGELLSLFIP